MGLQWNQFTQYRRRSGCHIYSFYQCNKWNIYMNDDENYIHKYYAPFVSSKNHEDVSSGLEYDSVKRRLCGQKNMILDLLLKI